MNIFQVAVTPEEWKLTPHRHRQQYANLRIFRSSLSSPIFDSNIVDGRCLW